jgi:uncharacterized protein with PQ loop repeat
MDVKGNENENTGSIWAEMGFMVWLSLTLPVFFIVLGSGILAGVFFTNKYAAIDNPIRMPAGIGLILWGVIRIALIFRRLYRQKRGVQHG